MVPEDVLGSKNGEIFGEKRGQNKINNLLKYIAMILIQENYITQFCFEPGFQIFIDQSAMLPFKTLEDNRILFFFDAYDWVTTI